MIKDMIKEFETRGYRVICITPNYVCRDKEGREYSVHKYDFRGELEYGTYFKYVNSDLRSKHMAQQEALENCLARELTSVKKELEW